MEKKSASPSIENAPVELANDEKSNEQPAATNETAGVLPREIGGREGPEPTRFGDWEKNGRCIDF